VLDDYSRFIIVWNENYYFPGEPEQAIREFVEYYNYNRYHEALNNLIPADVFYGHGKMIITQREITKEQTLQIRRSQNLGKTLNKILLDYEKCIS